MGEDMRLVLLAIQVSRLVLASTVSAVLYESVESLQMHREYSENPSARSGTYRIKQQRPPNPHESRMEP